MCKLNGKIAVLEESKSYCVCSVTIDFRSILMEHIGYLSKDFIKHSLIFVLSVYREICVSICPVCY